MCCLMVFKERITNKHVHMMHAILYKWHELAREVSTFVWWHEISDICGIENVRDDEKGKRLTEINEKKKKS